MANPLLNLAAILMEFMSSFISFAVGYYALKAYRTTTSRGLFFLYWGFLILGVGTFLRVFTSSYVSVIGRAYEAPRELIGLINFVALIYSITQIVAYSLFAITYVFQTRITNENVAIIGTVSVATAVFPIYRLFFIPWLELLAITLLGIVTASVFMNWRIRKSSESGLVFFGFGLMLFSHILFLFLPFREMLLLYGQATQFAGFICLLTVLTKVSGKNA